MTKTEEAQERLSGSTSPGDRDVDVLLAEYIDLMNREGPASHAVKEFLKNHQDNQALLQLAKAAREVQGLFAEGYLKKDS